MDRRVVSLLWRSRHVRIFSDDTRCRPRVRWYPIGRRDGDMIRRRIAAFTSADPRGHAHGVAVALRIAGVAAIVALLGFGLVIATVFSVGCVSGEPCPLTTTRLVTTGILIASLVLTAGGVIVVGAALVRAAVLISLATHQKRHRN
jgi:hypothetical protein